MDNYNNLWSGPFYFNNNLWFSPLKFNYDPLHRHGVNPHPVDLARQTGWNEQRLIQENHFNQGHRIHQQYEDNVEALNRYERIRQIQMQLLERREDSMPLPNVSQVEYNKIPDALAKAVNNLGNGTQIYQYGILLSILLATTVACCGRVKIKISPTYCESAILHGLILAQSGCGKTTVHNRIIAPFKQFEAEINQKNGVYDNNGLYTSKILGQRISKVMKEQIANILNENFYSWGDEEIHQIEELVREGGQARQRIMQPFTDINPTTIVISAVTRAQALKLLKENGEILSIMDDEGEILKDLMAADKEELRRLILHGYTHSSYNPANKRARYNFTHMAINLLIFTQINTGIKFYNAKNIAGIGLQERLLVFCNSVYRPSWIHYNADDSDGYSLYNNKIRELLEKFHNPASSDCLEVGITQDALSYLEMNELEQQRSLLQDILLQNDTLRGWYSKARGQMIRIAWAIHCWNNDKPWESDITSEDMKAAYDIMRCLWGHAQYMSSPSGFIAYRNAEKIAKSIDDIDASKIDIYEKEGITSTAIQQRTGLKKEEVINALGILSQTNKIALFDEGKGNVTVVLRPRAFRHMIQSNLSI